MAYCDEILNQDFLCAAADIPAESADIIIADPPYNIGKDFGNDSDRLSLAGYVEWSGAWIAHCLRILKPTGTMFIYGFAEHLAHLSVSLPINQQRWLQWHYTNRNMPNPHFWQRSHESILCVWKEKPIFNCDDVREPYTQGFLKVRAGQVRPAGRCRLARDGGEATVYRAHANGAMPRDVITVSALAGGAAQKERAIYCKTCKCLVAPAKRRGHASHELVIHPTQKPLALTRRLIMSCRPRGSFNVLAPFCGSGTECACARELGGNFLSYELNPDYIVLARAIVNSSGSHMKNQAQKTRNCRTPNPEQRSCQP